MTCTPRRWSRVARWSAGTALLSLCLVLPARAIEMFTYFGDGSRIGLPSLEVPVQAYPGIPLRSDRIRARARAQQLRKAAANQSGGAAAGGAVAVTWHGRFRNGLVRRAVVARLRERARSRARLRSRARWIFALIPLHLLIELTKPAAAASNPLVESLIPSEEVHLDLSARPYSSGIDHASIIPLGERVARLKRGAHAQSRWASS